MEIISCKFYCQNKFGRGIDKQWKLNRQRKTVEKGLCMYGNSIFSLCQFVFFWVFVKVLNISTNAKKLKSWSIWWIQNEKINKLFEIIYLQQLTLQFHDSNVWFRLRRLCIPNPIVDNSDSMMMNLDCDCSTVWIL